MPRKTNKTSHILDLITNGAPAQPGSAHEDTLLGEKTSGQRSRPAPPMNIKVVDETSRNDYLSNEILSSLTEELEGEIAVNSDKPESCSDTDEHTALRAEPSGSVSLPDSEEKPGGLVNDPALEEELPAISVSKLSLSAPNYIDAPKADLPVSSQPPRQNPPHSIPWAPEQCHISECYFNKNLSEKEYTFANVMEHLLLRQNLDAFLEEYQVCSCKRCQADVCALALSNLPSKYVVVSSDSLSPLLGFYEKHFKIRLMTELIKACIAVRDTPRHSRNDLKATRR